MSMPFDASLKNMVRRHVPDFREAFHLPDVNTLLDVDLSTVSAATDIVLADANPPQSQLVTLDFQSGNDPAIDDRILMYQGILRHRYHLPIHSLVLLLRPDAFRPTMTGSVLYETSQGRGKMDFRYEMIRLWEIPATDLLDAGIGAASLAVLGKLSERKNLLAGITDVLHELERRFRVELTSSEANELKSAVGVLLGLRVPREVAKVILERVLHMEESTTYQLIIEKGIERGIEKGLAQGESLGRVKGAREMLLSLGGDRLGAPSKKIQQTLAKVTDVERLQRMIGKLFDAESWPDVLATK